MIVSIVCMLTIFLVYKFIRFLFPIELTILLGSLAIILIIGFYWLYLDFSSFRRSYLKMLDDRESDKQSKDD